MTFETNFDTAMRIRELLNPLASEEPIRIEETYSSRSNNTYSAALEVVYQNIKNANPKTQILQELMSNYPDIPSLTYLRSWFFNRHNKYKRHLNLQLEDVIESLRRFSKARMASHSTDTACQLLRDMQSTTANYLLLITKLGE
eukprot:NODE_913_length_3117_cov_0.441352.p3 type:complete len:143 gc:universal NODE_913_length_3117_cov_0.441352:1770-1342(-)